MSREYVLQPFRPAVNLHIDYARELNEQQYAAVTAEPGPSLVIAGAGSGKTRALTYRVAYLMEQGIPPERVLLLTFTNKAATEMMRRVADLAGCETTGLWGGTFHAIGNRVLRLHADRLGLRRDFSILDRDDAESLLKTCVKDWEANSNGVELPKSETTAAILSLAANRSETISAALGRWNEELVGLEQGLEEVRASYSQRKLAANSVDFDDLLILWLRLLREHPELAEHYQRRFQFILVDEYQDTNQLQSDLIDLLAVRHQNLMVVGDDAQSIYGWRGANFQNILGFPERYPAAKVYRIETNYRSTPQILEVANAVLACNTRQFAKQLVAAREAGPKPVLAPCVDTRMQAAFVAQRVQELREAGGDLGRTAVLYRSHFHALDIQLELTRRGIPFSITSGIRFFEQAHIKDVTAYLRLVLNPRDEAAFKRLVQLLPAIGAKGADKLWSRFSAGAKVAGYEADPTKAGAKREAPVATALAGIAGLVPKKGAVAWAQFLATVAQLEAPELRQAPGRMIKWVVEAGYEDYAKAEFPNYRSRLDDLEQVAAFARQFAGTEEFLAQLALLTNLEAEAQTAPKEERELRLSTIHQAKGLEFDTVFVVMLCDGMFPSARSLEELEDEEEERRLFYVAITRARNELYFSYPLMRLSAEAGFVAQEPSRFLGDIPRELLEELDLRMADPYG